MFNTRKISDGVTDEILEGIQNTLVYEDNVLRVNANPS